MAVPVRRGYFFRAFFADLCRRSTFPLEVRAFDLPFRRII
jgi:hypothetical protein